MFHVTPRLPTLMNPLIPELPGMLVFIIYQLSLRTSASHKELPCSSHDFSSPKLSCYNKMSQAQATDLDQGVCGFIPWYQLSLPGTQMSTHVHWKLQALILRTFDHITGIPCSWPHMALSSLKSLSPDDFTLGNKANWWIPLLVIYPLKVLQKLVLPEMLTTICFLALAIC